MVFIFKLQIASTKQEKSENASYISTAKCPMKRSWIWFQMINCTNLYDTFMLPGPQPLIIKRKEVLARPKPKDDHDVKYSTTCCTDDILKLLAESRWAHRLYHGLFLGPYTRMQTSISEMVTDNWVASWREVKVLAEKWCALKQSTESMVVGWFRTC